MLTYTPMKNLAGITLIGDYVTLKSLHETIHKVAEGGRLGSDAETLLALAYDVRKAFEAQREVIEPPAHYPEVGTRFGVKIIWPTLLIQSRQLRCAMAYDVSSPGDQACAYALEAVIEDSIKNEFGTTAQEVLHYWRILNPLHSSTENKLNGLGAMFSKWTKAERKKRMAAMLTAFGSMHDTMHDILVRSGHFSISPKDIEAWSYLDWVDPETGR